MLNLYIIEITPQVKNYKGVFMKLNSKSLIIKNLHKELITIDFNESCNNKCKNCPRPMRIPDSDNTKYWSLEDSKKLIDHLIKLCTPNEFHIGILSEFCIHPNAGEILSYLNTKYPNIQITCTTNLTNMSDRLYEAVIHGNKNLTFNASMWAWDESSYEDLHGTKLFNVFNNNLEKLIRNVNNMNSRLMVSTVNINDNQHSKCLDYLRSVANKYDINMKTRTDSRNSWGEHIFTVYTNVYTDTRDIASKNINIRNSTLNYVKCNLPEYSAYITYNRLYACPSSDTVCKFDINNLDDFSEKLAEIHMNGSKLDICKTCTVAYSCLNVR